MSEFVYGVVSIVLIDLALAGDNAVVIGMAAARLPVHQRNIAVTWGAAAAIVFRIILTIVASLILGLPLLQAAGGAVLIWVAYKLLRPPENVEEFDAGVPIAEEEKHLFDAISTIVVADLVMSLDNILAIGGMARGHLSLLIFGLILSILILMVGGRLVAGLIDRYPWLTYLGSGILAWTAGVMLVHDPMLAKYWERVPGSGGAFQTILTLVVLVMGSLKFRPNDIVNLRKRFSRR